ncbi:Uncharacterised protein [Mycobacteroides abscessus subsp. abscessus]|uniref:hypothetical protein n=1 Tax=Mycobacteroides abscessus TaxID=36809 RepID=UPI000926151C|nr:hypothetical protein [Mycobacteroides abscessus]SHX66933.1 Uncharacterised protein [Mycobacteroides abscessus subsp. abscessus]SIC59606.1 Uncharacterised protein [Mycobacteroides abscessus subsp. abscessus]SKK20372.1 Uncharacterised protein [Mycobacteroides abscessus subsp. abscessus]SKP50155.1 Uncharacterised protein [Mycobacteroides abscessus subsp. abscessus]SKR41930.1 Uncharacterised protein [Mycobacteroides abscessus subsp. abscessus]
MPIRGGNQPLSTFAAALGFPDGFADRPLPATHPKLDAAKAWLADDRPSAQNHWPALVLALIVQAEVLLAGEGADQIADVFTVHPPEESSARGRVVNTLNFTRSDAESVKLRPLYNLALGVITYDMLRTHPSNPGHATQSWRAYRPLIELIYGMSPGERAALAKHVWQIGVVDAPEIRIAEVRERLIRPFEFVLVNMPTTGIPGLPGGGMLQGITYGYFRADSPNLILESHKVNTGSSRAGRIGDVDGFRGGELELAAEVKDLSIEDASAVADFVEDIAAAPNATAVVVCQSVADDAREEIESRNITVLTMEDLTRTVGVWDLPKQQEGLRGVDYFLGRVQKSAAAQQFFRNWLRENDLDAGFVWVADNGGESAPDS